MNYGDLVRVHGYGNRVYQIDGYYIASYFYPNEQYNETVYELSDVVTGEWLEADADDLTLVAPAAKAAEYLATMKPAEKYTLMEGVGTMFFSANEPTARELSAQEAERRKAERKAKAEAIDRLLDEYNDYKRLADAFGDEEYREKACGD